MDDPVVSSFLLSKHAVCAALQTGGQGASVLKQQLDDMDESARAELARACQQLEVRCRFVLVLFR
jgi:hypothetical protein